MKKIFFSSLFLISLACNLQAALSLEKLTGKPKVAGLSFLNIAQSKKKQLDDLEKQLILVQTERSKAESKINFEIKEIENEIEKTKKEAKKKENTEEENRLLSKKIIILNDRKLNITNLKESWRNTEEITKKQILLLQKTIGVLESEEYAKKEIKLVYTWKELQKIQRNISELIVRINDEKEKKENIKQQQISEKENLYSLQKQSEIKNKNLEELRRKITNFTASTNEKSPTSLKLEAEIIKQEIKNFSDKINNSNLILKKLKQEILYKEREIEYLQYKLSDLQVLQVKAKERLILDIDDIETAKEEWRNETQKSTKIKENLNKEIENKKREKDKILVQIEKTKTEMRIARQTEEKKESPKIILLETRLEKLKSLSDQFDLELKLINLKKAETEFSENLKKLQYEIINVHYKLAQKDINLDETLQTFISQKEILSNDLNNLLEEDRKANDLSRKIYRNLEAINAKIEKVEQSKQTIFKNENKTYQEILKDLESTKTYLDRQRQINLEFSAKNSELIQKQENEILNQYNFIIKELEAKIISLSIWERSPKAISPQELQKAFLSAEIFLQSLFWETPRYLGPSAIITNLKRFTLFDFLKFLLFILLLIVTLFMIKKGLLLAGQKVKNLVLEHKNKTSYLYLNLLATIIEFTEEHLKLIWTWIFINLHILFKFKYLFSTISPLVNPYSISIFYLASIPILVYLSKKLLLKIKQLNEKLSYVFFAEKFQNKFITLLNIFLYSSSILLPLRQAFLSYTTGATHFPDVLLAAYSLILVVVLLFFFSKEDVLKLIPSTNNVFIWLKKKIDKHYYPVFISVMGLLIISNPYIGYSNLAWYLALMVPLSIFIIYGLFFIHHLIRKYSMHLFIKEEDEEIIDKFENAKTFYGFFIITTFLCLLFVTIVLLSRLWNLDYTAAYLWKLISEDLTITLETGAKLGIFQFIILVTFITSGFLISSLNSKFMLDKLFSIFRTEPGTQNTISRIMHYTIIILTTILGFTAIHLGSFILWAGGLLVLGAGFGLKDLLADFIAGFFVLLERPVEIGHFIETGEIMGTVHKISPRSTTIRTARNFAVIVPNKDLINKPIINWGQGRFAVGFEMSVIVTYGANPKKVEELLRQTISKHSMVLKVPGVTIRLEKFTDNGMQFFTRSFVSSRKVRDQWQIASDIRFEIIKTLRENNIDIPYSQTTLHFVDDHDSILKQGKSIQIKFDNQKEMDIEKPE